MSSTQYQKRGLNVNGNIVPTVLRGRQGSPQLVAIYNLVTMKYASKGDSSGSFSEKALKSILNDFLDISIESMYDISPDQAKEVKYVLANIRTEFSLQPRLSGHVDFVNNPSFMLCRLLNLIVLHGWVLDPEVSIYDTLKDLSHSELVDYSHGPKCKSDHQIVCQGLLNDSSIQLTSYGFKSLSAELEDDGAALLCHKRLDIIHKYKGVLFILVTDKDIYEQMPQAVWRLFEERQESNIYFTESFTPVREQQHRAKAMDWYRKFLETQRKDVKLKEEKGKEKTESSQQREADGKVKKLPQQEQSQSCQQVLSDDAATKSSEPSEAARKLGEDKSSDKMSSDDDKRAVAVGSHHSERSSPHEPEREEDGKVKKLPQQEQSAAESSESSATTRKEGEDKLDKATPDDHKRAEAVGSHHSNISVGQVGLPEGVVRN